MRPYLTIALLLVASIGAQAAEPATGGSGRIAPGLLSALMEQPAGIFAASTLSGTTTTRLLLGTLAPTVPAICSAAHQADSGPVLLANAITSGPQARPHPESCSHSTRAP